MRRSTLFAGIFVVCLALGAFAHEVPRTPAYAPMLPKDFGGWQMSGRTKASTEANPGDYAQTNSCGTGLEAGASCTIHVTFTPKQTGKRPATLSIVDNGGGSPQYAHLCGTGT